MSNILYRKEKHNMKRINLMDRDELFQCEKFEDFKKYMSNEKNNFKNWTTDDANALMDYLKVHNEDPVFKAKYDEWIKEPSKKQRIEIGDKQTNDASKKRLQDSNAVEKAKNRLAIIKKRNMERQADPAKQQQTTGQKKDLGIEIIKMKKTRREI